MTYDKLIEAARKAKKNSYSPYSRYRVGSAVLTTDGKIYTGCNIENSSFSLTICAERTALFKAVSDGKKKFKAIVVSSDNEEFAFPCGACRQVISELAGDVDIILTNGKKNLKKFKTSDLLPYPFTPKNLE